MVFRHLCYSSIRHGWKAPSMSTRFDKIAQNALSLPIRERVRLAQRLVRSVDAADESEEDVEQCGRL